MLWYHRWQNTWFQEMSFRHIKNTTITDCSSSSFNLPAHNKSSYYFSSLLFWNCAFIVKCLHDEISGLSKFDTLTFDFNDLHQWRRVIFTVQHGAQRAVPLDPELISPWGHRDKFTAWNMTAGMNIWLTIKYEWIFQFISHNLRVS